MRRMRLDILSPGATGSTSKSPILRCMMKAGIPNNAAKIKVIAHLVLKYRINKIKHNLKIHLRMLLLLFRDT